MQDRRILLTDMIILKKVNFVEKQTTEEIENFEQIKTDITCFFQSRRSVMITDQRCNNVNVTDVWTFKNVIETEQEFWVSKYTGRNILY